MSERQQPDASSSSTDLEQPNVEKPIDIPEDETEAADRPNDAENVTEKTTEGAPLDHAPSQAAKMGKNKIIVVMTALCLALFLAALDMTIISTALPTIAAQFGASESGFSWIASSYLLANAACIPLWGKISDIWGRKSIIVLANVVFLVGSLICALAHNMATIIAGRAVQGVGGGGIIILANISVSDLFSLRDRPMYYGLFGATWAVAGALGPVIGGAFTTNVTWRWCFYLNLPVGGVSLAILVLFLHIESPKTPFWAGLRCIDWTGTFLIIGGTLMFLFGLEFGGVNYPWASPTVICLIVFGVFTWALAMFLEWKVAKFPIIPPRLFNEWYNILILLVCFCHGFTFIAATYYLPLYFQTVLQASPIMSGVYVLPLVMSLAVGSAATGVVMKKTGRFRELIIGGMSLMALGFGLFIDLKAYASWPRIIIYQLIAGVGIGPNFQAPLVAFQANIRPADMATATATFGFVRQLSTSMSVVLGTVIYQNIMGQQSAKLIASLGAETAATIMASFGGSSKSLVNSLAPSQREVVLGAYTHALNRMWIFYTCMACLGFVLALFIRRRELTRHHTIQKTGLAEQERARQELIDSQRKDNSKPEIEA
ncbi:Major facilitator superfamily domain, general substrate transporter [Penicillium expansum]|uniref:Efflux pump dotC n=1 Tax=Penicillium expansum TaxID=27334 RepID=A0A0A2J185_PENEN|nr:Major facilitator superfamily domain, general substrate transporter [Penicillium expansum]KGO48473.1 Major facilitator superfamily domain, general substrate transporter [Penicillium expansum]KGO55591.1 Major facilitator superfamily domain, general substrate transporter [Penicillium expansum]KGO65488.1 Major facilitator superfamily domain, general substrate transporter [Penicillium expansum]